TTGPCAEPMMRSRFSRPACSSAWCSSARCSRYWVVCMGVLYAAMTQEPHRLDKWLWHTRFYKTRSLATAAINGGKAHLNGERVKPAHHVRVGDRLSLSLQGMG